MLSGCNFSKPSYHQISDGKNRTILETLVGFKILKNFYTKKMWKILFHYLDISHLGEFSNLRLKEESWLVVRVWIGEDGEESSSRGILDEVLT
jgi:hypothetical protein